MRWLVLSLVAVVGIAGCSGKKSSLLLERPVRGEIDEAREAAKALIWTFDPAVVTQEKQGVEVTVNYASQEYLTNFFANQRIFGQFAGRNPYFAEQVVFYVKVANKSDKKILFKPGEFVLLDDRGNQYSPIGTDYVSAFADYKGGIRTTTRGMLESASPGYMGFSIPVGKVLASKPQGNFALLLQSALQTGYLHPGVVHDGLIAFWSPIGTAKKFQLIVGNIKTDFDANDEPRTAIDIPFEFQVNSR